MILNSSEILKEIGQGFKELGAGYANALFLFMKNSCAKAHAVGFWWITVAPPMLTSAHAVANDKENHFVNIRSSFALFRSFGVKVARMIQLYF
jgi:hypothetical protein